jgi:hypothetical protein
MHAISCERIYVCICGEFHLMSMSRKAYGVELSKNSVRGGVEPAPGWISWNPGDIFWYFEKLILDFITTWSKNY